MENIEYTEGERSYYEDDYDSNIFKLKLVGKSRKQAINQIFEILNSAPAGERFNPALRIADHLIDHVIMHEIIVESDASATSACSSCFRSRNYTVHMHSPGTMTGVVKAECVLDKAGKPSDVRTFRDLCAAARVFSFCLCSILYKV
ncbi:MAG: hypothetical protein IJU20_05295 [Clostridia bacterium]|nr:hypothetical protein [Clostridia bacterium]